MCGFTGFYRALPCVVMLEAAGFDRVLMGFTGLQRVSAALLMQAAAVLPKIISPLGLTYTSLDCVLLFLVGLLGFTRFLLV